MKKIIVYIMLIAVFITFCSCGKTENTPAAEQTAEAEATKEPQKNTDIVAIVGDEIILLREVEAVYNNYVEAYELEYSEDEKKELYYEILDSLIDEAVEVAKAEELGYTDLSDDDAALAEEYTDAEISARYSYFYSVAESENDGTLTEDELEALAVQYVAEYVAETKETEDRLLKNYSDDIAVDNMFNELLSDVELTEEEINAGYEKRVEEDKQTYTEHPDYFASDKTTNILYYNLPGYRYVKHIMCSSAESAEKVYALTETVEFETLMTEYGDDEGADELENGYCVGYECDLFSSDYINAAMELKNIGDISEIIEADGLFYIIKYYADIPEGPTPLEEVRESLEEELLSAKKDEKREELISEWRASTEIKIYDDILLGGK